MREGANREEVQQGVRRDANVFKMWKDKRYKKKDVRR